MTNDGKKGKNEEIKALLGVFVVIVVLFSFIGLSLWWMDTDRRVEELKPTAKAMPLPIVAGPFKQDKFIVYELEHGWMVMATPTGRGNSFFVPKPPKQE